MQFSELEPPSTRPRGKRSRRSPRPGSASLHSPQSNRLSCSWRNASGMWITGSLSGGPASITATRTSRSSPRRAANTQPAEPAPTIT